MMAQSNELPGKMCDWVRDRRTSEQMAHIRQKLRQRMGPEWYAEIQRQIAGRGLLAVRNELMARIDRTFARWSDIHRDAPTVIDGPLSPQAHQLPIL